MNINQRIQGKFLAKSVLTLVTCAMAGVYTTVPLFSSGPVIPIEQGASFLLTDWNRNGLPDILTYDSSSISILLGDGRKSFILSGAPKQLDSRPGSVAVIDVNGDALVDFCMTSKEPNQEKVYVYLRAHNGTLKPAPGSPFAVNKAIDSYKPSLRFADLNEDGKVDIVTANGRRNTLEVCLGDGKGGFSHPKIVTLEPGRSSYTFEVADMDGDGHLDLVTASGYIVSSSKAGQVFVRRGDGTGTFAEPVRPGLEVGPDPKLGALGDLNQDRLPDLVITHGSTNVITTILSNRKSDFTRGVPIKIGMTAFTVSIADINKDKYLDIVALTTDGRKAPHASQFEILISDGQGNLKRQENLAFRTDNESYKFAMGDLNMDGNLDLVVSSFGGSTLKQLYGL